MEHVMSKISDCGKRLQAWNRTNFGNVKRNLQRAKYRLKQLQESDPMGVRREEQKAVRKEVQKWLERDEVMWRQRSKELWLREGDQNSKFFHIKVSHRKKKNQVGKLQNEEGALQEGDLRDKPIIEYF
ncbi:uncharacterized protein LOC121265675 [Juglans microcarpa x Juglans regia]|uniref:uncharacterized protein LOC121265675 n=1 Tax=Juglans microcarpa x Juglans regia TaxID=2249226 RepID=UPI001B7F6755|nr:uncharacterized protein LOC121265675 [Juglans microcarpa x Juglans regia]